MAKDDGVGGFDRRKFLRNAALTGLASAWAAPVLNTVRATPAFGQSLGSPLPKPSEVTTTPPTTTTTTATTPPPIVEPTTTTTTATTPPPTTTTTTATTPPPIVEPTTATTTTSTETTSVGPDMIEPDVEGAPPAEPVDGQPFFTG